MPTGLPRPCLGCGVVMVEPRGSYCYSCCQEREKQRGTAKERGYDAQYWRDRSAAIRSAPVCANPVCPYPDAGTPSNPLTADHTVPLKFGGRGSKLAVVCRRCNSSRGANPRAPWISTT